MSGQKNSLGLLSKNKMNFYFYFQHYWTYLLFVSLCHITGNFIIPSSQNILAMKCSSVICNLPGECVLFGLEQMLIPKYNIFWIQQMSENFPVKWGQFLPDHQCGLALSLWNIMYPIFTLNLLVLVGLFFCEYSFLFIKIYPFHFAFLYHLLKIIISTVIETTTFVFCSSIDWI